MAVRNATQSERKTASQRVYEAIRAAISKGRCKVGERLIEDTWAVEMDVSRTPVREALQRLASDGFVVFTPHAGAFVRGWSAREASEVFEIRANLEGLAAGLAAERADSASIRRLERAHDAWCDAIAVTPRDTPLISERNRQFHGEILAMSGNSRLESMCLQMMDLGFLTRAFSKFNEASILSSSEDHAVLLKALSIGDGRLAEALMRSHILAGATKFVPDDISEAEGHDLSRTRRSGRDPRG